jgi:hypothetical protein
MGALAATRPQRAQVPDSPFPAEVEQPVDLADARPGPAGSGNPANLADHRHAATTRPAHGGHPAAHQAQIANDAWDRMFAKLDLRLTAITTERDAAPGLLAELLAHPPARRAAVIEQERRFCNLSVCDLLVEKIFDAAARAGFGMPPPPPDLAELALLASERLDSGYYGTAMVNDMRSRAWAALASARRAAGDWHAAEQALALAESLAEDGSADPLEEARLLELRAALLSDQGWFEEAVHLIDAVVDIYDDVKDAHRLGRALIKKGLYLGHSSQPQQGVELIPQGLALLDRNQEPELALHARHHLAWFLNDCGDWRRAQAQLAEFRRLQDPGADLAGGAGPAADSAGSASGNDGFADSGAPALPVDTHTALRLDWLEARIAHRSGHLDEAEWRLRRVRQAFVERAAGLDAAMVILDLAGLYLDQVKPAKVRRLADELLPIFLSRDLHREAAAALVVFQQAVAGDRVTPSLLRQIAAYLRRGRRESAPELPARGRIA